MAKDNTDILKSSLEMTKDNTEILIHRVEQIQNKFENLEITTPTPHQAINRPPLDDCKHLLLLRP